MTIAIRGSAPAIFTGAGATVSGTLTGAQQPQAGDTLVVIHCNDFYTLANMPTPSVGGSTTGVNAITNGSADGGTNGGHIKSYTRAVASTGDLAVSVTETGTADEEKAVIVYVLSGVDSGTAIDVALGASAASSNQVAPDIPPSSADAFEICHVNTGGGAPGGTFTPPSGMAETYDQIVLGAMGISGAVLQLSASGATGSRTFTNTNVTAYVSLSIAVKTGSAVTPETNYAGPFRGRAPGRLSPAGEWQAQASGLAKPATVAPVGVASETDAALALGRAKARTLGVAAETDTALTVGRVKTRSVGIAGETDTAQPITSPTATRHNLCPNPAAGTNATGWSSDSSFSRATGLTGLPVSTGAVFTGTGYLQTPTGAAAAGNVFTVSLYVKNDTATDLTGVSRSIIVGYTRSAGGDTFPESFTVDYGAVGNAQRVSFTCVAAPANTTGIYLVMDTLNVAAWGGTGIEATAVLYEVSPTLGSYFDGDTAGARWDGTPDNSTSTFGPQVTAIGTAAETDSAQALGPVKARTLGVAAETSSAQAVGKAKAKALGVAAETDAALPVTGTTAGIRLFAGPWTAVTPGWKSPTGQLTPQPFGSFAVANITTASLGTAAETDSARQLGRAKTRALGVASTTDIAISVGRTKRRLVGMASTTDVALVVSTPGHLFGAVGTAVETDLALAVGRVKTRTVGVATTTSAALAMGRRKTRTVGVATTTDVASPGGSTAVQRMPGILTAGTSRPRLTAGNSRPRLTVGTLRGPTYASGG